MAIAPIPQNVEPTDGATDVSVTPLLVAKADASTIAVTFVEQYDDDTGLPIVIGWDNDPRRR